METSEGLLSVVSSSQNLLLSCWALCVNQTLLRDLGSKQKASATLRESVTQHVAV